MCKAIATFLDWHPERILAAVILMALMAVFLAGISLVGLGIYRTYQEYGLALTALIWIAVTGSFAGFVAAVYFGGRWYDSCVKPHRRSDVAESL